MFGDWHLALASYNGGPGRVQRAVKRSGHRRLLGAVATQAVPAARDPRLRADDPRGDHHRQEPAQYGFDVDGDRQAARLRQRHRHRAPSTCAASPSGPARRSTTIQALNPELRRWTTPVRAERYDLKVPAGTGDKLRERLASAPAADLAALHWYRVKRGESLATIARKLGVSRGDLAEANGLSAKARVRPGQELLVPRAPSTALVARAETAAPAARNARAAAPVETRRERAGRSAAQLARGLQGAPRRHAREDRPRLRHHGRRDQVDQPASRQPHRRRRSPHDQPPRRPPPAPRSSASWPRLQAGAACIARQRASRSVM